MHFLFVTYRWGADLVGGAEIHHRRLAEELVSEGHKVSVITSEAHHLSAFMHWGVEWKDELAPAKDPIFSVERLKRKHPSRWRLAIEAKLLQMAMEREEAAMSESVAERFASQYHQERGIHLLHGWHYPEMNGDEVSRWTHPKAWIVVRNNAPGLSHVTYRGNANTPNVLRCFHGEKLLAEKAVQPGYVELPVAIPERFHGILRLEVEKVRRFERDHRTLGIWLNSIELNTEGQSSFWTDLNEDFRALGRRNPKEWQAYLLGRCQRRPGFLGRLFDHLRGPNIVGLRQAINRVGADHVIHCNMPWGSLSAMAPGELAMPLWHTEDEFYYWKHWIAGFKKCRLILANTPYTAREFFPQLGIKAEFVGPPIWPPEPRTSIAEGLTLRRAYEFAEDEMLVLTVCRKSGEKRYDTIAEAVVALRREGLPIRMLGIGPDVDKRPFNFDGCIWAGKLTGEDLQRAYSCCDVFALLSESESFGMVIPEAWHHGKPVLVNRLCAPTASLLDDGVDGLLVEPGESLKAALRRLYNDSALRISLGEAGQRKAEKHYTKGAAAKRLLNALQC